MDNKISIIIPTYNGEDYIKRTIDSIYIKQKYNNFEVIVVNDGSTDKTIDILEELKKEYGDLIIINKSNTGVSDSRNVGINNSTGNWIMFCDDDDEYEEGLISKIFSEKISDCDLIIFGRIDINGNIKRYCNDHHEIKKYNDYRLFVNDRLATGKVTFSVCNKIYRSETIKNNNIEFDKKLKFNEDLDFNLQYIRFSRNILENFTTNYIRYCNQGSTMYKKNPDFMENNIKILNSIKENYYNDYDNDFFEKINSHYLIVGLNRLFTAIDLEKRQYRFFKVEVKKIYDFYKKNNKKLIYDKNIRNIILFSLFRCKLYYVLFIITIYIGDFIRKFR